MNQELVERIANAVLYEGYILYPYRASSVKNQRRFNFGVLTPPEFGVSEAGAESSAMRTECLVSGGPQTTVNVRVRFLQVMAGTWQDAVEREVRLDDCAMGALAEQPRRAEVHVAIEGGASLRGMVTARADLLDEGVFRLTVEIVNSTRLAAGQDSSRDEALAYAFAATHTILEARGGEFVSLIDPPEGLKAAAKQCQNVRTWPVLAGEGGQRQWMLSSPIILYDYPEIAPESPGDLFDGTEIDEILTLRIMTLSDEEKAEIRKGDERARRILERTESLPAEQLAKLHGALRGLRPAEQSQ